MDYKVSSLKEVIDICLEKLRYDKNDISAIRNIINKAIKKDVRAFTSVAGVKEYIEINSANNGIVNELKSTTGVISDDIEELIKAYIDKFFKKYEKENPIVPIKEKTNLEKVAQKIRYFDINSSNDQEFLNNIWNTFKNIFSGNDKTFSSEEIRYDMIYAALKKAEIYRDYATILKRIDPTSKELTEMDAIRIVEEYVYDSKINELLKLIDSNPFLSGLLLQNLFDYTYLKKETKDNKYSLDKLDKQLEKITDLKLRSNKLIQVLNGEKIEDFDLEPERLIVDLLKNTLALNIYTNNKKYVDYEERKLYIGEENDKSEETIQNRMMTNNELANNLIIYGLDTSIEELVNIINNLNDKQKYFLANIYVLSRSTKDNKNKLDNAIYYGTNEQIYIHGLLEKEELIKTLKQKKQNIM